MRATALGGGALLSDREGYFVNPTLLVDVKPHHYVVQEKFFGAVVAVVPFDDEDEAIEIVNNSDYGPFSYVFCGDLAHDLAHGVLIAK